MKLFSTRKIQWTLNATKVARDYRNAICIPEEPVFDRQDAEKVQTVVQQLRDANDALWSNKC